MSKRSQIAGLLIASVALALAPRAHADAAEDRAAADALYEEAGRLMKADRWAEACPKLETSQRLDPGTGTLIRLGYCYAHEHKTASAWAAFNEAAGLAQKGHDGRADDAAKQAKLLEPQLSRLVLEIAPENRGPGLQIRRDGKAVDPGLLGSAVPVDPGSHAIEATQPGKEAWTTTIQIEAKPGVTTVRVPVLAPAAAPAEVTGPVAAPVPGEAAPNAPSFTWTPQRRAGVGVGSVGIAGALLGAIAGGLTLSKAGEAKSHCQPMGIATACDPTGLSLRGDARTLANVANVALGVGGAAVVVGVVVFATAPSGGVAQPPSALRIQVGPAIGAAGARFSFEGAW